MTAGYTHCKKAHEGARKANKWPKKTRSSQESPLGLLQWNFEQKKPTNRPKQNKTIEKTKNCSQKTGGDNEKTRPETTM